MSSILGSETAPSVSVILTMATAISFPLARTFSIVRAASPRRTRPAIMVASKPCALSSACAMPSWPAVASMAKARR
jgi:hypothetical protein